MQSFLFGCLRCLNARWRLEAGREQPASGGPGFRLWIAMSMADPKNSSGDFATIAFVDIAGFSAIADVHGDASAIAILDLFESMVRDALSGYAPPIKWIGDEAMLAFPEPAAASRRWASCCRPAATNARLPLVRAGINHGPVIRRGSDLFGSTVNVAARVTALAAPGQLMATQPVADAAAARGIRLRDLGMRALRSVAGEIAALCDRTGARGRPVMDRPGVQDARALCALPAGQVRRSVVLLAALRDGLPEVSADLSACYKIAGLSRWRRQPRACRLRVSRSGPRSGSGSGAPGRRSHARSRWRWRRPCR